MSQTSTDRWHRYAVPASLILGLTAALLDPTTTASAQVIDLGASEDGELSARVIQLFLLVTLLSLAPGIAIMITCFPFMVTVLSLLRQGIGLQAAPPNMLIISLAIFLTWFVMEPVLLEAWRIGLQPLMDGEITPEQAFERGMGPFRAFMESRVRPEMIEALAAAAPGRSADIPPDGPVPLSLLIPSFMLTEIERGFEIGFIIFLPFLIIDLVVASILMSMGMMMVPPVVVSLPLKLAFFVVADGWSLLAGALIRGYAT